MEARWWVDLSTPPPVDQTLSPRPDRLGPIHQDPGEVASPRPKGRPLLAGPPAPGGEAAETLLTG